MKAGQGQCFGVSDEPPLDVARVRFEVELQSQKVRSDRERLVVAVWCRREADGAIGDRELVVVPVHTGRFSRCRSGEWRACGVSVKGA